MKECEHMPGTWLGEEGFGDVESSLPPAVWGVRQGVYPRDCGVHEVFLDIALRHRDCPAIRTESGEMNYRDLDRRANQLAQFLIGLGVVAGDRIGLFFERSPDLIIAQLAILKAGAVYVPIDPSTPLERVAFFAQDAGFLLLLCGGDLPVLPGSRDLRILSLEKVGVAVAQASAADPGRSRQGRLIRLTSARRRPWFHGRAQRRRDPASRDRAAGHRSGLFPGGTRAMHLASRLAVV